MGPGRVLGRVGTGFLALLALVLPLWLAGGVLFIRSAGG